MSEQPPPYPGTGMNYNNYSTPADFSSQPPPPPGYSAPPPGYAPPPQPYDPMKAPGGYPPQNYGGQYQTHSTVVVNQPAVTLVQTFRESPVRTRCNHCSAEVVTGIHFETGTFAWVICIVLWLVGCGLGCCLIPFCYDGCKDVIHTCPNCHQQIARFSRM